MADLVLRSLGCLLLKTNRTLWCVFNHLACSGFFVDTHFCHDELIIPV